MASRPESFHVDLPGDRRAPRRSASGRAVLLRTVVAAVLSATTATAQPSITSRGSVSATLDALPGVDATELRLRLEDTVDVDVDERWAIRIGSWADGLVGVRRGEDARALVYQPGEIYARYRDPRFDVTAGFQRIVWGTLDEIQPTDLVNPLDVGRFLMEGRSDARLPVFALRGRAFLPRDTTVDVVYVPFFRRGRYDLVDEATSPFNLRADSCPAEVCLVTTSTPSGPVDLFLPLESRDPARTWRNGSIGGRVSRTVGGLDASVSGYRGWQAFPLISLAPPVIAAASPAELTVPRLLETWSRLTMIGGDVEAARGAFTWRAEGAFLVDTAVQAAPGRPLSDGRSLQLGAGIDWTSGPWRTFGNVIVRRAWAVGATAATVPAEGGVQLVGGTERTFSRDTRRLRAFAVVDPSEGTAFLRLVGAWNLRDNLWLEGSSGVFTGDGTDLLGQFTARDFVSARIKYYF